MLRSKLGACVQLGKTSGFLGKDRSAELLFVCSDMWQAYLKVIAKKVPQAIHVLDRFHVMLHPQILLGRLFF
ncbi:MAG: transposase [Planctomycetes bacterium]|nr:transposase [Planctomycetota bacterium]